MEYAIVESGGKQYKAVPGETIEVDRLVGSVGEKVVLDHVLLISDGKETKVGQPTLKGAKVETTLVAQFKAPKIIVFKYKPRNRYRVKSGHRQQYTRLKIEGIKNK
jgi:large subunit ribosomal protein L21